MTASQTKPQESQSPATGADDIFLVDGSGFIFRAYYALPQTLTNPKGEPVGAVLGFSNMLLKLLTDFRASTIAVIFDAARQNFRYDIYPEYKANRSETPPDLIPQFPLFRVAAEAFGIPAIELEGYEADDLIATYARIAKAQGKRVTVVGSDKDLFQIIGEGVQLYDPLKQKYIGEAEVIEKFGVPPGKVIEVQALSGDATDNIPGVPGIGPKTAAELINQFGSVEALLENLEQIKQPKRREVLTQNAQNALISKRLVTLADDVPVPVALEDLRTHAIDNDRLTLFLQEQGFKSLLARMNLKPGAPVADSSGKGNDNAARTHAAPTALETPHAHAGPDLPPIAQNAYTLITEESVLKAWIAAAYEAGILAIDTETTSLTPARANLVGISLAITPGKAAYIPLGHITGAKDLFSAPDPQDGAPVNQLPVAAVIALLKPLLEDDSVLKIGHNIKYDWQMFARHGIRMTPCDDTMLISYVLDGSAHSHGMDSLSEMLLGHKPISYDDVTGKGKARISFDQVPIARALDYAAEDADITLRLHTVLKPRLAREKMMAVYEDIERPLIPVIAEMELTGICVDPQFLQSLSNEFGHKLVALESDIHKLAGHEFNIASPKQVAAVLFGEMGLQGGKKTGTGEWSTAVDVLDKLADQGHEIVQKILEHRQLSKLKSTYSDALQEQINPLTGRVHTSFAMAHTNTGRLSSSDPNLQNIPIRTEDGKRIRQAFIASPGHVLISADYSQVELRLAAELAGIEALRQAFRDGVDIHTLTSAQVFGIPLEQVTPELRRQAKAVNFGIIYGISGWGLAKQLGTTVEEANNFIRRYLARFPELQTYMEATKEEARRDGYVKTLYGRKCVIRGVTDKNPGIRNAAERQAINAPLQGTAADIMKIAMARMNEALKSGGLNARMLLQVHDELVFEVPESEIEATKTVIRDVMENAHRINGISVGVPLLTEAGSGASWAAAH